MDWYKVGYVLACVAVPTMWGLVVVWVSNALERRVSRQGRGKHRARRQREVHPIEYHI